MRVLRSRRIYATEKSQQLAWFTNLGRPNRSSRPWSRNAPPFVPVLPPPKSNMVQSLYENTVQQ
jgi:hypothetical protein